MTTRLALTIIAVAVAVVCLWAVLATAAEDNSTVINEEGVWLPRAEAADAFGKLSEVELLRLEVETQAKVIAAQDRIIETQARLVELSQREAEAHERLAAISGKERDAYKAQVDRGKHGDRWLRCQAYGATAALVGSVVAPPLGTAAGAIVGCAAGLVIP